MTGMIRAPTPASDTNEVNPVHPLPGVQLRVQTHPASRIDGLLPHNWNHRCSSRRPEAWSAANTNMDDEVSEPAQSRWTSTSRSENRLADQERAMKFAFTVTSCWSNDPANVHHLIGLLTDGAILSGARAHVLGMPGIEIHIKSVVIAPPVSGNRNEITVSIERPALPISELVGRELVPAE